MNDEDLALHIEARMRTWSQAMYGIVHAMRILRAVDLGNIKKVGYSMRQSLSWVESNLGFDSSIPERDLNVASFDLEGETEEAIFSKLASAISNTLTVSLTSLLDECLGEVLAARGYNPHSVAGGKLDQLRAYLPENVAQGNEWALTGARELVTIRNVLVHSGGVWNERPIKTLPGNGRKPATGEPLSVGFGDVLRYKRAVRTLLNEAQKMVPHYQR
ncbi:MAG: hypothetical protein R3B70_41760 [Polyangiaceae bacterium]